MNKLVMGAALAALASSTVFAEDYQFEVGASYISGELGSTDYDGFSAFGTIHFDNVDTSKGPLLEAPFLDKSSYVSAIATNQELDFDGAEDYTDTVISGRFVIDESVIIEAAYTDIEEIDDSTFALGLGTYLNDNTDIVFTYKDQDEADQSSFTVDLHSVVALENDTAFSYDLGVSYLDVADENGYSIIGGADYFFNKLFSVGASYAFTSVDEFDASLLTLDAHYFVTPKVRVSAAYTSAGQDADEDAFSIGAALRF